MVPAQNAPETTNVATNEACGSPAKPFVATSVAVQGQPVKGTASTISTFSSLPLGAS